MPGIRGLNHPAPTPPVAAAAVLAGAVILLWPALLNGYPLVFSDTGGFLHQTLGPLMLWDKPWVYGPLLHLFHWRVSLWLPLVAQGLVVSHLLWLAQRALRGAAKPGMVPGAAEPGAPRDAAVPGSPRGAATPGMHLLVCLVAAALTTAPFTVAMLMPDLFAPVVVLALFLLGPGRDGLSVLEATWLAVLAAIAIAAHLSHLPLAAGLVVVAFLAGLPRGRAVADAARVALPVGAAVALLLVTNWAGHGRAALSPHGATFMLARLQADGPAAAVIRARCPDAGWYLCAFADRLPMDANDFLWDADSPVNRDPQGRARFLGGALISAEAGQIVGETLRAHPLAVAAAVLRNTLRQLVTAGIGDTLGPNNLATALRPRIAEGFPPREVAAFDAGRQARGRLAGAVGGPARADVAPVWSEGWLAGPIGWPAGLIGWLAPLHAAALLLALPLLAFGGWRAWKAGDGLALAFIAFILAGLVGNAVATGGLSGVFPRYQARIAWLLPVAAVFLLMIPRKRA